MSNNKLLELFNRLIADGYIRDSFVKSIKKGVVFSRMVSSQIIEKERKGAGYIWIVKDRELLIENRDYYFPNKEEDIDLSKGERYKNIRTKRNSKATSRKSYKLFFLRTNVEVTLNSQIVIDNKPLGGQLDKLIADKICFVENLENFMEDDYFINQGWTLIYVNGRIGKDFLESIDAREVKHWGDLDYVGLDEFARIKERFSYATLYIPKNYFEDAKKYGMKITTEQKASDKLLKLSKKDEKVAKVLEYLQKNNLFLEQEGYSYE
jgi:hypothetical protein